MGMRRPIITLTTDFGTGDAFVGSTKGVILGISPEAVIVDITHEVPPMDIESGAYHLANAWQYFPSGAIHVAVVDPGVGSSRRALAVSAGGHLFLAPDNGLLTHVLSGGDAWRAVSVTEPHYLAPVVSRTFHGRDLFAPAAAHLSRGTALENLGPEVLDPVRFPLEAPQADGAAIRARVLHVDRFGNLVLNLTRTHLVSAGAGTGPDAIRIEAGGATIDRFVSHYEAAGGALCCLINSDGRLEIARPGGSAAETLGISRGAPVLVRLAAPPP